MTFSSPHCIVESRVGWCQVGRRIFLTFFSSYFSNRSNGKKKETQAHNFSSFLSFSFTFFFFPLFNFSNSSWNPHFLHFARCCVGTIDSFFFIPVAYCFLPKPRFVLSTPTHPTCLISALSLPPYPISSHSICVVWKKNEWAWEMMVQKLGKAKIPRVDWFSSHGFPHLIQNQKWTMNNERNGWIEWRVCWRSVKEKCWRWCKRKDVLVELSFFFSWQKEILISLCCSFPDKFHFSSFSSFACDRNIISFFELEFSTML